MSHYAGEIKRRAPLFPNRFGGNDGPAYMSNKPEPTGKVGEHWASNNGTAHIRLGQSYESKIEPKPIKLARVSIQEDKRWDND